MIITTVYYGASAETVRGFLSTPIERVVSAISGVDYVESTSRAGVSTVTVHLKLNHSSTAALAEVTARLQQVRAELPTKRNRRSSRCSAPIGPMPPSISASPRRNAASRPSRTGCCARSSRNWPRWPASSESPSKAGDRSPCASGSIPTASHRSISRPATYRTRCGATTTWPRSGGPKGNFAQINLLANTDLRSAAEFEELIVADRGGAIVRLKDMAKVEREAEEADMIAKYNETEGVYLGIWPCRE